MGNANSVINVTLDQTQPAIYFAGDIISGQVHFNITERTNKIDEIYLSLTGDVGYTITRTVRMQNGQIERKTDCHNVRILGQKFLLGRPMFNEQTNKEMNLHEITTLEPGQYRYPFSIRLPEDLPPSLHPEDYPFVRYQVQVCFNQEIFLFYSYLIIKKGFNRKKMVSFQ
jgi:sporulation-control protein spo0M